MVLLLALMLFWLRNGRLTSFVSKIQPFILGGISIPWQTEVSRELYRVRVKFRVLLQGDLLQNCKLMQKSYHQLVSH